jgi:hypothetical protein
MKMSELLPMTAALTRTSFIPNSFPGTQGY